MSLLSVCVFVHLSICLSVWALPSSLQTEDYLKRKIRSRPERSELVRMHILEGKLGGTVLSNSELYNCRKIVSAFCVQMYKGAISIKLK